MHTSKIFTTFNTCFAIIDYLVFFENYASIMKTVQVIIAIFFLLNNSFSSKDFQNSDHKSNQKTTPAFQQVPNNDNTVVQENKKHATIELVKAKNKKDNLEIIKAFKKLMFLDEPKYLLKYSDSIISYALQSNHKDVIGNAYLSKGVVYYNKKEMVKALNCYIDADKYIAQSNNNYAKFKLKYVIAQTKYYLGLYDEALSLLLKCEKYFAAENDQAYVSTLHLMVLCHTKMNNFDLAEKNIAKGIEECIYFEFDDMKIFFEQAQAINNFYLQKYSSTLDQLKKLIDHFKYNKDYQNIMVLNFYTAKCYWEMGDKTSAISFLLEVAEKLSNQDYIKPEFRETYEMLIQYYSERNDDKMEMRYSKELIKLDKIIAQKYIYLSNTMYKKYDTRKLVQGYEKSLKDSENDGFIIFWGLTSAPIIILILIYRNIYNKKKYLKKFEELMLINQLTTKTNVKAAQEIDISDISETVVQTAMENLLKFELEQRYLEVNMNLTKLSKILKTNIKYASRIILKHSGTKTVDYINDLKINYIIQLLKKNPKYRKYTTAALSIKIGFGSPQNFTRAFKSRTHLTPMLFIKHLQKAEKESTKNCEE